MDKISKLYDICDRNGINTSYYNLVDCDSLIISDSDDNAYIAIDPNQANSYKKILMRLAHEMGHYFTGTYYSLGSPLQLIEQREYKANKWAVHKLIPFESLEKAVVDEGYTEDWELAEYFDVSEDFIQFAFEIYRCEGKKFRKQK